jgi:HAAS
MNATTDSVEAFLQTVAAHLPGPSKHRAAILAELNDGLLEATESYQRTGLDRAQAVRLALREFGDPQTLAESFRSELIITRGRRSALTLLTAAPIVIALWIAAARSRDTPPGARLFDSPTDHVSAALLLVALAASGIGTLLMSGRLTRWLALPPHAPAVSAAAMGLITVIGDITAVADLGVRLAGYPGTLHVFLLAAAITASCASVYIGTRASRSCLAILKAPL